MGGFVYVYNPADLKENSHQKWKKMFPEEANQYINLNHQYLTSSIIAFFDISGRLISFKEGDDIEKTKEYVIDRKLKCGIRVRVRNDRYFLFDFKEALHAKPLHIQNASQISEIVDDANIVKNERVDFLHAFLCCLISQEKIISNYSHSFDLYGMNNYIICSRDIIEIEEIVAREDLNYFSSYAYFLSVKHTIENKKLPEANTNDLAAINSALGLIDQIMLKENPKWFYSLGLLYRANNYYRHGLNIDAATFARAVFEWLAKNEFPDLDKKNAYESLVEKYKVDNGFIEALRKFRHTALHDLQFPTPQANHRHALGIGIAEVITLYKSCSGVDLEILTASNRGEPLELII